MLKQTKTFLSEVSKLLLNSDYALKPCRQSFEYMCNHWIKIISQINGVTVG